MAKLIPDYTSSFKRDVKALKKKHRDTSPLREVIELVVANTASAKETLRRRHNALSEEYADCWRFADGYCDGGSGGA